MPDLPLQCRECIVHTELRTAVILSRTLMQVTNTFACNAMFALVSILSMVKLVLEYHRFRGCHRLSGYPGMPRGRLQFLVANLPVTTRVPPVLHPHGPRRSPARPHHLLKIAALRISLQWSPQSLSLPDTSLAYINARILSHPHLHRLQSALPIQRDHFMGVTIS